MTDITSQSALRRWRSQFLGPVPYIVLGSVATLLAILGPFGTGDLISLVDAFFYWLVIAAGTYSIGFLTNIGLAAKLPAAWRKAVRFIVVTLVTGSIITPFITVISYFTFDDLPALSKWLGLVPEVFAITLIVNIFFQIISDRVDNVAVTVHQKGPTLLDRLPLENAGALSRCRHKIIILWSKRRRAKSWC